MPPAPGEFFSIFIGTEGSRGPWSAAVEAHAAWLGASVDFAALDAPPGRRASLARWRVGARDPGEPLAPGRPLRLDGAVLSVSPDGARLSLRAPLASPAAVAHAALGDGGLVASDDLRLFARLVGAPVDDDALRSLLCYGCPPPGRTLFRGVEGLAPGYELTCEVASGARRTAAAVVLRGSAAAAPSPDDTTRLRAALDAATPRDLASPVVLLSGGVDSALLLATLRERGGGSVTATHFEVSPDGGEVEAARAVAATFGARLDVVRWCPDDVGAMLTDLYRDYAYPFGDFSATVTNLLVRAVAARHPEARELLDGTGADALFAVGCQSDRWRRAALVPRPVLRALSLPLRLPSQRWRDGLAGRAMNVARRLVSEPVEVASVLSRHALSGLAFALPAAQHEAIVGAFLGHLDTVAPGAGLADRLALLDLLHGCARQMAAKNYDPARARGMRVVYPFLDDEMIAASQGWGWGRKCARGEPKALLKEALAERAPRELVYRHKSGFTPDIWSIFRSDAAQDLAASSLITAGGRLDGVVDRRFVRDAMDRLRRRRPVSLHVMNFLWCALFTARWLGGATGARAPA